MAYIGKSPAVGNFIKLDAITATATATYNLLNGGVAYSPESVNHMLVSLNGVIQSPTTAFTVSGTTIVFASTLSSSDVIDFIMVYGDVLNIGVPSDATVTDAKITAMAASKLTGALPAISGASLTALNATNLGSGTVPTARLGTGSASSSVFLSGANTWIAAGGGDNTPSFFAHVSADYSISDSNHHIIAANTELWDTDSAYTNTAGNYKFTVPSGEGGKYQFTIGYKVYHGSTGIFVWQTELYKNGSWFIGTANSISPNDLTNVSQSETFTVDLAVSDYIQAYTYIDNANNTSMDVRGGSGPIYTCFSGFKLL